MLKVKRKKYQKRRTIMEKKNKNVKKNKLREATLKEWRKLGLPETTTTIHFGTSPSWVRKLKELNKK